MNTILNTKKVNRVLTQLRGYFRDIYVGGSIALQNTFPQVSVNDVDIFILGKRQFETWALENILFSIFDSVRSHDGAIYYKIAGQYKHITASYAGYDFDLIFVDASISSLIYDTASELSKLYYKVIYEFDGLMLAKESEEFLDYLKGDGPIHVDVSKSTDVHIGKLNYRAKLLGKQVILTNEKKTIY